MANQPGFLQNIIGEIGEFFTWLKKKMADDEVRRATLLDLGLNPDKDVKLQIPDESLNNIDQYRKSVNADDVAFQSAVHDVKVLYTATKEFVKAIIDNPRENPQDIHRILWQFFEVMGTNYIRLHRPGFYWVAQLMGFLVESGNTGQSAVEGQGTPDVTYNVITKGPVFLIENLWELITHPIAYPKSLPEKLGKVYGSISDLDMVEDAENWSELMIVLAGFFNFMEKSLPESRYLYGWDVPPKKWTEDQMADLNQSFQGKHLLYTIRKDHKTDFPIDEDNTKAWEKIEATIAKTSPDDIEKKIIKLFKRTIEQWKRGSWSDLVSERAFSFDLKFPQDEDSTGVSGEDNSTIEKRLGATMFFVSDEEVTEHFNKDTGVKVEALGGLFISLNGELNYTRKISENWDLTIKTSSDDILDIYASRLADANVLGDMNIEISLKRKADSETGASYNLPDAKGTRLAVGEIHINAFLNKKDGGIEIGLKDNAVVIGGGDGDGFLNSILPSADTPLKFSVSVGLSKKKGFYVDHNIGVLKDILGQGKDEDKETPSSGLERERAMKTRALKSNASNASNALHASNAINSSTDLNRSNTFNASNTLNQSNALNPSNAQNHSNSITSSNTLNPFKALETPPKETQPYQLLIPLHKDLGLLYFDSVKWDYGPVATANSLGAYLKVLSTFTTKLGPLIVRVENTGLGIAVTAPTQEGDLETTGFSYGFTPPKGVGIRIDSDIISGGGFLELDFDNHQYAGVLAFKIPLAKREIGLVAVGLINTRLPNGEKGFSMLISIGVFFNPGFQLSFGFTLNAVGGLIGIHRTMKVDILRERIQNGAVNSIMFPENVIQNSSKIISDLRAVFPPQKNHYVVAPFFRIGYSTPAIIEVDLGILIEFPFKGRFILLGSIGIYLPNKDVQKRLGEIHVDIFGDFNFAASYILIEGRLRDSNLVGITLTGGFAFMLDWGSNPQFLLSVGGYHPRYKKPDRFPAIPRVTALIKKGDDIRLSCQYYQAITSNSYQLGFSAELVVKKGNALAYGFMAFDALLQFDPFYFEVSIRINVEISYRGRSFFGVDLEFILSGPEPWRAQGYAKIKILFFSLKVKFNYSWGGEQKAIPVIIKPDEILQKLKLQLQQPSSWSAKLPDQYSKAESMRSLDESEKQDQIFMHPSGYLELRQNLVPLNKTIKKIGNSYVESQSTYQILDYQFGAAVPIASGSQSPLLDYFSRGQFEDLPDNEKISTPDFDLMTAGIQVAPDQVFDISTEMHFTANEFEDIILGETSTVKSPPSFNWQGDRVMNLTSIRKPINAERPEEMFGVIDKLPSQQTKTYKILSKDALQSPDELKQKYFHSYSSARDYLRERWPKEQEQSWQVLQAEREDVDEMVAM